MSESEFCELLSAVRIQLQCLDDLEYATGKVCDDRWYTLTSTVIDYIELKSKKRWNDSINNRILNTDEPLENIWKEIQKLEDIEYAEC